MEFKMIKVETRSGVAYIGLNRQEQKNALNAALLMEVAAAFSAADEDSEVGAIVLHSLVDKVFCAGADLKERVGMDDEQLRKRRVVAKQCYEAMERVEKPTIAAVDGKNFGGGCEFIGACDIVVGSERAAFCYPEVRVGSVGATQRITRLIGPHMAKDLLFTGRIVEADEALRIGLLARKFSSETFMAQVEEMATTIASRSPVSLNLTKKAINMGAQVSHDLGVVFEQVAIELNIKKGDWRKGVSDFAKKA